MPLILVNGDQYSVALSGQGPALVALHGFTGSAATWRPLARALSGDHTVVAVDLLGHGGSSRPPDTRRYALERTVDDLVGLLDALGLSSAVWLGYSMGGRIALGLALEAPERCRALVLESASPGIRDPAQRAQRAASDEQLARRIEAEGIEAFVDCWESLPLFASQARLPRSVRDGLRAQRLRNHPGGLASSLRGIGAGVQRPLHQWLPELAMPACFIAGGEDERYRRIALEMATAAPRGKEAIVPEAGHAVHLERPEEFHRAVREFLVAHQPAPVSNW